MAETLFAQLGSSERAAVAALYGAADDHTFAEVLRATPALPDGWTLGDAARAALVSRLDYLLRLQVHARRQGSN